MKRAFDANVSRAKPRTKLSRAFADAAPVRDEAGAGRLHRGEDDDGALSPALAAALLGRSAPPAPSAAAAAAIAHVAGGIASTLAAGDGSVVMPRDGLEHAERELASLAGGAAHREAAEEPPDARRARIEASARRIVEVHAEEAARAAVAASSLAVVAPPDTTAPSAIREASSADLVAALAEARFAASTATPELDEPPVDGNAVQVPGPCATARPAMTEEPVILPGAPAALGADLAGAMARGFRAAMRAAQEALPDAADADAEVEGAPERLVARKRFPGIDQLQFPAPRWDGKLPRAEAAPAAAARVAPVASPLSATAAAPVARTPGAVAPIATPVSAPIARTPVAESLRTGIDPTTPAPSAACEARTSREVAPMTALRQPAPVSTTATITSRRSTEASETREVAIAPNRSESRPARKLQSPPAAETVLEGHARIDELRRRLAATRKPAITAEAVEPGAAARAVRDVVEELRNRLAEALGERDALARALEVTRDELAQVEKELTGRAAALAAAERLAAERARVADELVDEAEALAEERDRAMARIAELKTLDETQSRLVAEAEEALAARDAQLAAAAAHNGELTVALDSRAAESEELAARLTERTLERDALATRIASLEAEVRRLQDSREALAEIQRVVSSAVT